jgi:hypothetical protein
MCAKAEWRRGAVPKLVYDITVLPISSRMTEFRGHQQNSLLIERK